MHANSQELRKRKRISICMLLVYLKYIANFIICNDDAHVLVLLTIAMALYNCTFFVLIVIDGARITRF